MPSTRNKVQPQNISHEHELDSKGVYQLANGAWAYRFCKSVNGKNVYKRASTDRKGNPLLKVGINDQFYFSKLFKAKYFKSPQQYRKI